MLISASSHSLTLWQQKQDLLDQLGHFANLSIFDEPQEKEILKTKLLKFIYCNLFDPIYGGLLVNKGNDDNKETLNKYYKPLLINIYLHEIFTAAGQVFYDGELNYCGKLIFRYLITQLENKDIEFERYDELKNIDNYFSSEQLTNQLNDKEKELFFALISDDQPFNKGYLFCYKRSLKEASDLIDMEYKQAQILDYSIKEKLKTIEHKGKASTKLEIQDNFSIKCELITSLVNHGTFDIKKSEEKLLFKLFNELYIDIRQNYNYKNLIHLITSGIYLLQLSFELELLSKIEKLVIKLYEFKNTNKGKDLRLALLVQFFGELYSKNILSYDFEEKWINFEKEPVNRFELIYIDKNQVDMGGRLVNIKSKYNSYRLVFLI